MLILVAQIKPEEGESTAETNCYAYCRTLVRMRVRIHNNIQVSTKSYQTHIQKSAEQVQGTRGILAKGLLDSRCINPLVLEMDI